MERPCPLCSSILIITKKKNKFQFFCDQCGYEIEGPLGYDLNKSYIFVKKNETNKSKKKSYGFPTKQKNKKRSFVSFNSDTLEEDKLIEANIEKVNSQLSQGIIPQILNPIIQTPYFNSVYFKKLEKSIPPMGDKVTEFIKIKGLRDKLQEKGINHLYQYQEDAYREILNGNNLLIAAPTGMGKTEAFLLPIIYSILINQPDPSKRKSPMALFMYPTKALAADQLLKIQFYCNKIGVQVAILDGDTPQNERQKLYINPPDILISNADMIHYHLMGNHQIQTMVSKVSFLVLDEIHLYVGSFGSNIIWIIRRIRRFSPNIQCIGASATISNLTNFAETLFDQPVKILNLGTSRKSELNLSMVYPKQRSNLSTMATVAHAFVKEGKKTLIFGNGHRSAESLNLILNEQGMKSEIHRAGLPKKHRKRVEDDFRNGKLEALVSTPTLELGIDIGSLDSVISMLTGLTNFVQRIGRAGRSGQESFATLVLRGDDPISAFYARNPEEYLTDLQPAFVEPNNQLISKFQVMAMILDKPLELTEIVKFETVVEKLINEKLIRIENRKLVPFNLRKLKDLLGKFSIRGIGKSIEIWHINKKIGERSLPVGLSELHPGGIYLHGGKSYSVQTYNEKIKMAKVNLIKTKRERTQALRNISPEIIQIFEESNVNGLNTAYCELELTETVNGYIKQDIFTNKILGKFDLEKAISYDYRTMGFLLALPKPEDFVNQSSEDPYNILGGTFHAIEHVLIESGNSLSGGGANQIGGISLGDTGLIFVYDGSEGGSGLSRLLYEALAKGLTRSLKILQECPCKRVDGCPRCTYSYQCGNNNQPLNRLGAIDSLQRFGKDATEINYDFEGIETYVIASDFFFLNSS